MNLNSIMDLKNKRKVQPERICLANKIQILTVFVLLCIRSPFVDLLLRTSFLKSYIRKATIEIRISSYFT